MPELRIRDEREATGIGMGVDGLNGLVRGEAWACVLAREGEREGVGFCVLLAEGDGSIMFLQVRRWVSNEGMVRRKSETSFVKRFRDRIIGERAEGEMVGGRRENFMR